MESTIRLFKAVPITKKGKKKANKNLLKQTIKSGFVFSPEVIYNYSNNELERLIKIVEKELGLSSEQMNSSFHKSWKKVRDASIVQLVLEQIVHYITTYGFERLGIYDENSVYIPCEKLKIPNVDVDKIKLIVIKGYTKEELKIKLLNLLKSGIALKEETKKDIIDVATFVELEEKQISNIKNKEVRIALYDYFNIFPQKPIEFLRFIIYKSTNRTLLIKDAVTIEEIKTKDNLGILNLFSRYKSKYGLEKLAEIFYRFKPLFLAFRTNRKLKRIVNRIRKLAIKHHKPMKEDFLNEITAKIKQNKRIDKDKLQEELKKVNVFRKIRLAYALKFRTQDCESILYRIRSGKGYATNFEFNNQNKVEKILDTVVDSIVNSIKPNVKNKKIYIPNHIKYSLPATEKQFTGYFPSGTYISIPKDMIVGIHWENVPKSRIDLDLSLIKVGRKMGWDSYYRDEGRSILFSGDLTDAPSPKGASELFYVKRQKEDSYLLFVNYYNYQFTGYEGGVEVPYKILVAKEQVKDFGRDYMVNPNNVVCIAKSNIKVKQKILGLLITMPGECRFYFAETCIGGSITSYNSPYTKNALNYLYTFYKNTISLNDILVEAGAKIIASEDKCDINLSPEKIEKDSILNLLTIPKSVGSKEIK